MQTRLPGFGIHGRHARDFTGHFGGNRLANLRIVGALLRNSAEIESQIFRGAA